MLIQMLRFGLFNGPEPTAVLSEDQWQSLLNDARQQGVIAVFYHCVQQLSSAHRPPKSVLFHLASMASDIEQSMQQHYQALKHFADRVEQQMHQPTVVVKGLSLAQYYPHLYCRESGDNDLYFGASAHVVDSLMRSCGIAVDDSDPRHSAFLFEGVPFENHAYLLYPNEEDDPNTIDPQWDTTPIKAPLYTLVPEHLALFVVAHADRHALYHNESLRLRDLLDWALLLEHSGLDYHRFNQFKQSYDVGRLADLFTQYVVAHFGITPPEGWQPLSEGCLQAFPQLYLTDHPRKTPAFMRVFDRSKRYIRYAGVYKEIYGETMFRRFYYRNVARAIGQWAKQEKRHEGRERNQ